jgi:hypothetical protein
VLCCLRTGQNIHENSGACRTCEVNEKCGEKKTWVGEPDRSRSLETYSHILEVNVNIDIRKVAVDGVHWVGLAQHRDQWNAIVKAAINLSFP